MILTGYRIAGRTVFRTDRAIQYKQSFSLILYTEPASSPHVVNLVCWLNGSSLPLNQSHLVQLHLSVKAKPGAQQGDCVMALHDIKSNTEILSKNIPCGTSSNHMLTVTTFAKKWITNPSTNAGVSVRISAKDGSFPLSSLPFVSTHPSVEPPSYILYL